MSEIIISKLVGELNKKGVKRKEMPDKLNISYNSVINYLNAKRVMPIDVFFKIIETYKIDIRYIISDTYNYNENVAGININDPIIYEKGSNISLDKKIFELEIRLDECRKNSKEQLK